MLGDGALEEGARAETPQKPEDPCVELEPQT